MVPAPLGPNEWEFEAWTLWCHSPSPSIHLPSAGETHQSENRSRGEHLIKFQAGSDKMKRSTAVSETVDTVIR